MQDDWPKCDVPTCDNRVNPDRILLGYKGCVEVHGALKKQYTVIPVPKSNGVVGTTQELVGISGSHKGSTMSSLVEGDKTAKSYARYPQQKPPKRQRLDEEQKPAYHAKGITSLCAGRIVSCAPRQGGFYWVDGNKGLEEAYRTGLVTAKTDPSRLTPLGELVRVMLMQGKHVDIDELKGMRV